MPADEYSEESMLYFGVERRERERAPMPPEWVAFAVGMH
jgi:hypothetical protein